MITNLRNADDTTLIARTAEGLLDLIIRVKDASEQYGLYLLVKKTKIIIIMRRCSQTALWLKEKKLSK